MGYQRCTSNKALHVYISITREAIHQIMCAELKSSGENSRDSMQHSSLGPESMTKGQLTSEFYHLRREQGNPRRRT